MSANTPQAFRAYRLAPVRLQLTLAVTCAWFAATDGPRWLGFSSLRDYVRGRLNLPWASFHRHKRVGILLAGCPDAARALRRGEIAYATLDLLALRQLHDDASLLLPALRGLPVREAERRVDAWVCERRTTEGDGTASLTDVDGTGRVGALADAASAEDDCERRTTPDPGFVQLRLRLPRAVIDYAEETLRLASALLGEDVPTDQALAAVLAEAGTELPLQPVDEEDRHRFDALLRPARHAPRPAFPRRGLEMGPLAAGQRRRRALRLDRLLRQTLLDLDRLRLEQEDQLLEMFESDVHGRSGFPGFEAFAERALGLPARSAWDRLRRARRRRTADPLALARAQGRIGAVQADELERLWRAAHLPRSALAPWIEAASQLTTRLLREMIAWAVRRARHDYLAWSNEGFVPPTEEQLRTSNQPLHELVARADPPPELLEAPGPPGTVHWLLEHDAAELLLQELVAVQPSEAGHPPPVWWRILRIFHLARRAWEEHVQRPKHRFVKVLERDDYRCVAPECTCRRGLEAHHLDYRSRGGDDRPQNLATLCGYHHRGGEHGGLCRVRGQADPDAGSLLWELGVDERGQAILRTRGEVILERN